MGPLGRHAQAIIKSVATLLDAQAQQRAMAQKVTSVSSGEWQKAQRLLDLARRHEDAALIRRFVRALRDGWDKAGGSAPRDHIENWLIWAERAAELADPVHQGIEHIVSEIAALSKPGTGRN